MAVQEFRINNSGLMLHGLENDGKIQAGAPPVLFVPGLWGEAEQFVEILSSLAPRKAYALSLRGRGKSEVPQTGYSLKEHASDIRAFVEHMQLDQFIIATVSAGASYAIAYAAEFGQGLSKLIITDYPAISKSYPPAMVQGVLADVKNLKISEQFLVGLQRESLALDLATDLKKIVCPVTVFRGGADGAYLNDEQVDVYRKNLNQFSVKVINEMAHDPLETPGGFLRELSAEI